MRCITGGGYWDARVQWSLLGASFFIDSFESIIFTPLRPCFCWLLASIIRYANFCDTDRSSFINGTPPPEQDIAVINLVYDLTL